MIPIPKKPQRSCLYRNLIFGLIAALIALTGCARGRSRDAIEATTLPASKDTDPLASETIADASPTLSPTPEAKEATPALSPPVNWEDCEPNAAFVADITVPDDSQIHPGALFRKTWRIQNNGPCPWLADTRLIFQKGDALGAPSQIPLTSIGPNRMVDVGLDMQAPTIPGRYRGYWRLQSPSGEIFGAVLYVQIVVTDTPMPLTPVPTSPPQPTRTPVPATPTQQAPNPTPAVPAASPTPMPPTAMPPTQPPPTETPTASPTPEPETSEVEPTEPAGTEQAPKPPTCLAPDPMFTSVLQQAEILGLGLRCATGPTTEHTGRFQFFRANVDQANAHNHNRSLMVYNADTALVYAFEGTDPNIYEANVEIYRNRWDETQPEVAPVCEALAPPTGYQMPVREIGKAWCEAGLWLQVGWPRESAMDGTFTLQETTHGLLLKVAPTTDSSTIQPLLIAVDMETRQATTISAP
jgi:hypothetical protein